MATRAEAERLDAADELAPFRERFVIADDELVYLDGNSLGRLPVATRDRLTALVEQWSDELVGGWDTGWLDAPRQAGDALAPVIGAHPGDVVVTDSVTVNLYKLARAARREGPIVVQRDAFPTDRYVAAGIGEVKLVDALDTDAGLVIWSHVDYRTGELADLPAITAACRDADVPLIWDLSHSAGAVPCELRAAGAQLAVGCTYKYLNAGPGAPAFIYCTDPELRSPIWGWFAQRDQFDMERAYDPRPGIERFLAGTPPIMGLAAVEEGAKLTAEAGIDRIRAKSMAITEFLIECLPGAVELLSPAAADRRGSHVAIRHPDARTLTERLIERKVVPDFRTPDVIRLGIAPLYIRFVDVWSAMERLRSLL